MKNGGGAEESSAVALKKGPWTAGEDAILIEYVNKYGEGNWNAVQKNSGLNRCGKSCRLRWANHLRPNLKKGSFTAEEELLILQLHAQLGNKWARMATQLPGRTDNEIKNYWNTRIKRRKRAGLPLYPPEVQRQLLLRQGFPLRPPATASSASPVPSTPPPAPVPRTRLRPPPLSLLNPITLPSSPSPTAAFSSSPSATASVPILNQFSNGLAFQFPLSSPLSPPALSLLQPQHQPRQQFSVSCPVSPAPPPQFSVSYPLSPAPPQQFPFSCPVSPTVQSPLFQSQQPMHWNLGSFDVNPSPPFVQMPFRGELPSSQIPGEKGGGCGGAGIGPFQSTGSGLLDDMIRELQRGGEAPRVDWQPQLGAAAGGQGGDGYRDGNDVSKPSHGSALDSLTKPDGSDSSINGIEMRSVVKNEFNPVHEDISTLFDMIPAPAPTVPATMAAPDWYNSDSGELSNGPSSVMTDDDIGLEMHQLASSLSIPPVDREWNVSSRAWNDTSGIP